MKNNLIIKLLISLIIIYILGYFLIGQTNSLSIQLKNIVPDSIKNSLKKTIFSSKYKKFERQRKEIEFEIIKNEIFSGYIEFEEKDQGKLTDKPFLFKGYLLPYASPYLKNKKKSFLIKGQNFLWIINQSGRITKIEKNFINQNILNLKDVQNNLYRDYVNNEKPIYGGIIAGNIYNNKIWLANLKHINNCNYIEIISSSLENKILEFSTFKKMDFLCNENLKDRKHFNTFLKIYDDKIFFQFEENFFEIDLFSKENLNELKIKDLYEILNIQNKSIFFKDKKFRYKKFEIDKKKYLKINLKNVNQNNKLDFNNKFNEILISKHPSESLHLIEIKDDNIISLELIDFTKLHNKLILSSAIFLEKNTLVFTTLNKPRLVLLKFY